MLAEIYKRLSHYYGPQHWWPAENRFEVIVGAILTQNTAWTNVVKALSNLKAAKLLSAAGLTRAPLEQVARLIRPSGYFNQKAKKLKAFMTFLNGRYNGSLAKMAAQDMSDLRRELLEIHGIGPETADSILLYALDKPVFVVDAYTRRVLSRHGLCSEDISYEQLRTLVESSIAVDVACYNEFHALFVQAGKDFCRKKPLCQGCPLDPLLTERQRKKLSAGQPGSQESGVRRGEEANCGDAETAEKLFAP